MKQQSDQLSRDDVHQPKDQRTHGSRHNPHTHPKDLEGDRSQDRARPLPG